MTNKLNVLIVDHSLLADELRLMVSQSESLKLITIQEMELQRETVDVVVETTNLDLQKKKENLIEIEQNVSRETIIISTVLGITATQTASWLSHPDRMVGFATFANLKKNELIEVAPALQTDSSYLEKANLFFTELGKEVELVEDEVGLVFPRILSLIINEAAFAYMEGTATVVDIDTAMIKGTNYPLGPLAWADEIGIDDVYAVLLGLQRDLGEDRYRPAPIIRKMVYAGWLGKKSKKGFYTYVNNDVKEPIG